MVNMDYNSAKMAKGKNGEERVLNELKCIFGEDALYFQNVLIPSKNNSSKVFECDIICVSPRGIFVFEVKNWEGHIEADKLSKKWGVKRKSENYYNYYDNPVLQNNTHRSVLEKILCEKIVSIVVINDINNDVTINLYGEDQSNVPVLLTTELNKFFSTNYTEVIYSNTRLYSLFSKLSAMENRSKETLINREDRVNSIGFDITGSNCVFSNIDESKSDYRAPSDRINREISECNKKNSDEGISPYPVLNGEIQTPVIEKSGRKNNIKVDSSKHKKKKSSIKKQRKRNAKVLFSYVKLIAVLVLSIIVVLSINNRINIIPMSRLYSVFEKPEDIPETIRNRQVYSFEELYEMPIVQTQDYQDNVINLKQSLLYKTVTENYVVNYENVTQTAEIYITPVEYIDGEEAEEYYNYLSKKFRYNRPLRAADNEQYVVVRLYVWYQNDMISNVVFNKKAIKESDYSKNGLINFYLDGNLNYYWSNETNEREYIKGLCIEDFNNVVYNETISSGTPVEVIYLIPISKDLDYTVVVNPDNIWSGTNSANLVLE